MSKKKKNLIVKNRSIEELVYGTDVTKVIVNKKEDKDRKKEKQEKKKIKKQNKLNGIKLSNEEENINKIKVDVYKEEKSTSADESKDLYSKKMLVFSKRREAEQRQEEKDRALSKAITNFMNKQKSVEYKEEQEFFDFINNNKEKRREELKNKEDILTYTQRFREKYVVTLSSGSKNKNEDKVKREKNKNAGKSIKDILSGDEFKDLWNKNDDSHDEK